MALTVIFAVLALVVVGAYLAQRQRRRDYEAQEPFDDGIGDDWRA